MPALFIEDDKWSASTPDIMEAANGWTDRQGNQLYSKIPMQWSMNKDH